MKDLSKLCACVVDGGLFADFATRLAVDFGKVYLYVPWEINPTSNQLMIGQGLENVIKVDNWVSILDEVDLWVFPDVNYGPLQEHLVSLGKRVWGSRMGEELELFRGDTKKYFRKIGLNIGNYAEVKGLTKLRGYLREHENVYVKISRSRGDFETFHSNNYELIEPLLDALAHKLGAKKEIMDFIVEDAIEDAVEIGYDGYTADGRFPASVMSGIEVKDRAYVGSFKSYTKIAEQMREVNERLASTLAEYQYRNFWAVELRVTRDGKAWVIDPCCRAGSPPSQLAQLMYTNFSEIMWNGAEGNCIDPTPAGKFGALVLMHSDWVDDNWQVVDFPVEIRAHVKLHFPCVIDGRYFIVPQKGGIVGAVVDVGETLEKAIENVKEKAAQVKGYGLEIRVDALDAAQDEIDKLKEFGVSF